MYVCMYVFMRTLGGHSLVGGASRSAAYSSGSLGTRTKKINGEEGINSN